MPDFDTISRRGIVTFYNSRTGWGVVKTRNKKYRFYITSYRGNRPARLPEFSLKPVVVGDDNRAMIDHPRRGEKVDLIFTRDSQDLRKLRLVGTWAL